MIADYVTRLAVIGASSVRRPRAHVLSEVRMPLRIWPTDIDLYGHMNNGRYLTLMDFGRYEHSMRTGLIRQLLRRRWLPVIAASNVEFLRELRVFQKVELTTQVVAWDAKWFFVEHRLEREGRVHARAAVKAVVKGKGRTVTPAEMLGAMGVTDLTPPRDPAALAREFGLDLSRDAGR